MQDEKKPLLGMTQAALTEAAVALGMPAFTGRQMAKWLYSRHVSSIAEMTDISKAHRERLGMHYCIGNHAPVDCHTCFRPSTAAASKRCIYPIKSAPRCVYPVKWDAR